MYKRQVFKGANRHEFSSITGRAVGVHTHEELLRDIITMKQNNIKDVYKRQQRFCVIVHTDLCIIILVKVGNGGFDFFGDACRCFLAFLLLPCLLYTSLRAAGHVHQVCRGDPGRAFP